LLSLNSKEIEMKKLLLIIILASTAVVAQTTWDGPTMTFTKADNANPALEANQDRITSNVWLTRGSGGELYNAKTESDSSKSNSPADTRWALGTTSSDLNSLSFDTFRNTIRPKNAENINMVLHLVTDDIYIDFKITSWTSGQGGSNGGAGGFSYQRSTDPSLSIEDYDKPVLSVYPNPSESFLRVSGLNAAEPYRLYSILGVEIQSGIVASDQEIDIDALQTGMYMLQIANTALPFVKK
jgi:hypothetical protein